MQMKIWLVLGLCGILGACGTSTTQSNSAQAVRTVPTFYYPAVPEAGINAGEVCREYTRAPFESLGVQCLCDKHNYSLGYSTKSYRPGHTTECVAPSIWRQTKLAEQAERDRQEAANRAQQLAAEREWERTRPQREAEARRAAEAERQRLNRACPVYYIARQTCANAPDYGRCMNIRMNGKFSSYDDNTCFARK
jgi:hypothetical protein